MLYTPKLLAGLVAGILVGGTATLANGQSTQHQILVSVVDDDGAPVADLGPSDIVIREDGAAREVLSVRADTEPKQIALLVDTSQATGSAMLDMKKAAAAFVDLMSDGNEISIISFGGTPRILAEPTRDPAELRQGVDRIFSQSGSASYLLDAVSDTAQGFIRRQAPRPVIVTMTALGVDYSNTSDRHAVDRLQQAGIPIHTVVLAQSVGSAGGLGGARRGQTASELVGADRLQDFRREPGFAQTPLPDRNLERDRFLTTGPSATGGRRRDLLANTSTERAFANLAAQLRGQYLVVYSRPGMLIPPEEIEVGVTLEGLDARGVPIGLTESNQ